MSKHKRDNPKTVAAMVVATAGGLGLAYWSISNALAPPRAASTPTSAETAPSESEQQPTLTTTSSDAEPGITSAFAQSEADMAMEVDPFIPLAEPEPRRVVSNAAPPANESANSASSLPNLPLARSTSFPPFPFGSVNTKVRGPGPAIEPVSEPKLVGTLLGERPCAVFRDDEQLVIVPIGGKFGDWKVVAVSHDGVVVKNAHRRLRLGIGSLPGQETTYAPEHITISTEDAAVHNTLQTQRYIPRLSVTASAADVHENEPSGENPELSFPLPNESGNRPE